MKIAVYTIALNEGRHIARWAESCQEADVRLVADTGSTDDTLRACKLAKVKVGRVTIAPWRFDDARNAALALLPGDVDLCIALDCDEVLTDGWRAELEALGPEVTRPRYTYTWSWRAPGVPDLQYKGDKIHARHGYRWRHPVHEVLSPSIPEVQAEVGLQIHHHPDGAKPRSYLPLLELAVQEDPDDDRNAHYLARELYYRGQPARAAYEFKRHLALPRAVWAPERARSMMFLARVEPEQAEAWLLRACAEDAGHRDAWHDLADLYYRQGRWAECLAAAERCLSIGDRELSYISLGEAWGPNPYDYAAIACFRLGRLSQAVEYGQRALDEAPGDLRLANNLRQYEEAAGAVE